MADKQLREDILNAMALTAYELLKAGVNDNIYRVMETKYPGAPEMVIIDAVTRAEMQIDEEWWQQVEATIDGESVRKAVVAIADKSGR